MPAEDPVETPVWYRRLPPNNTSPDSASDDMSATTQTAMMTSILVPAHDAPSPAMSDDNDDDTTMDPRSPDQLSVEGEERPVEKSAAAASRRSPRPRRSPDRLCLRTAFRGFSGIATVVVGDANSRSRPRTHYMVHRELLTAASPFFAAALNSTFAEGLDQTVRLPEEKPDIFEWFLQWLYTGTLTTPSASGAGVCYNIPQHSGAHPAVSALLLNSSSHAQFPETATDGDLRNSQGSPKYFLLLDLYALSDRLLTVQLSNHILSTIARLSESTNSVPTPSDTWILYDCIRDSSPLRTLVLDLFAYKKTDKLLESHKDDWHPRFLRELVVKLKRPGPEAIERHALAAWKPSSYATSRACEGCKEVLKPGVSGDRCQVCDKAFCAGCLRRGREGLGMLAGMDTSGCKPWMGRGMCLRYHEHEDGELCC